MRGIGIAHEQDSTLQGAHREAAERMDLHNNELGIELALRHLATGGSGPGTAVHGVDELGRTVLRALAQGRGLVLDAPTATPRATIAADLTAVLRRPDLIDP